MLVRISLIISFLVAGLNVFSSTSPSDLFDEANKLYDAQQYDSSFVLYQQIESEGQVSPELFQNMGTAAYKLNRVPDAIYYFEKGLKLSPGNDDLAHNLKLAQEKRIDKDGEEYSTGIAGWLSSSLGGTSDFWATLAVIASVIGALMMFLYLFVLKGALRKIGITIGIASWVFTLLFTIVAYLQYNVASSSEFAILFEPSIEVRNDPSEAASIAFVLHEGCKLKILDENEQWYKVSYDKEKVGWLPKESVKLI